MAASLPIVSSRDDFKIGKKEKALVELWEDASHRLKSAKNLWTWFRLNRRFQLRFIRVGELHVEVPTSLLPDCDNCIDLCCTGPNAIVTLRLRDIAALVDAGLQDAIVRPLDAKKTSDKITRGAKTRDAKSSAKEKGAKSWAQRNLDASVFRNTFPVLARDDTSTCTLLTPQRQCGAWPAWPLSCARYPYALDVDNKVMFLAKGCQSHRRMNADDAPDAVRNLIKTAVRAYNERIKDIILLHLALDDLDDLGFTPYLRLPRNLEKKLRAKGTHQK